MGESLRSNEVPVAEETEQVSHVGPSILLNSKSSREDSSDDFLVVKISTLYQMQLKLHFTRKDLHYLI